MKLNLFKMHLTTYKIVFCCDSLKMDFNWLAGQILFDSFLLEQKFIEQRLTYDEMMRRYILIHNAMLVNNFPH